MLFPDSCVAHTRDLELADDGRVYLVLKTGRLCVGPLDSCRDQLPTLLWGQQALLEERSAELAHPFHGDPGLLTG